MFDWGLLIIFLVDLFFKYRSWKYVLFLFSSSSYVFTLPTSKWIDLFIQDLSSSSSSSRQPQRGGNWWKILDISKCSISLKLTLKLTLENVDCSRAVLRHSVIGEQLGCHPVLQTCATDLRFNPIYNMYNLTPTNIYVFLNVFLMDISQQGSPSGDITKCMQCFKV